jgi:circadian clock protein KaiB
MSEFGENYGEDLAELERLAKEYREGAYKLRLYVTGGSPRSAKAVANVRAICDEHLAGRYDLEVIDLYQHPELAREEQVMAAPTLVRELPEPIRRVVGDMSNEDRVLYSLNIERT